MEVEFRDRREPKRSSLAKTRTFLVPGSLLILSLLAGSGFRLPQNTAPEVVANFDRSFLVGSQVELYGGAQINADGSVQPFRVFILYQYDDHRVSGVFRLIPDSKNEAGGTLLLIQEAGKIFEMYFRDFSKDASSRRIPLEEMAQKVTFTNWNFEDSLDDDKTDRDVYDRALGYVDGVESDVVFDRFSDPEIQKFSAYAKRRMHFARDDSRYLMTEMYDRSGKLIKAIQGWHHRNVGTRKNPLIRVQSMMVRNFESGSITVQRIIKARYNLSLPRGLFSPKYLDSWSDETDQELMHLLEKSASSVSGGD